MRLVQYLILGLACAPFSTAKVNAQGMLQKSGFLAKNTPSGVALVFYPEAKKIERLRKPAMVSGMVRDAYYVEDVGLLYGYPGVDQRVELDYADVLKQQLSHSPIMSITAAFCSLDGSFLDVASGVDSLRTIDLGGTELSPELLGTLLDAPNLESLAVNDTRVDNDFFDRLVGTRGLECVSVGGTQISLNHIAQALPKSRLKKLYAHCLAIERGKFSLSSSTLQFIDLSFNDIRNLRLEGLVDLEEIFLIGSTLSQDVVNDISDF